MVTPSLHLTSVAELGADVGHEAVAEKANEGAGKVEHRVMGEGAPHRFVESEPCPQRVAERVLGAGQQRKTRSLAGSPEGDALRLAFGGAHAGDIAAFL